MNVGLKSAGFILSAFLSTTAFAVISVFSSASIASMPIASASVNPSADLVPAQLVASAPQNAGVIENEMDKGEALYKSPGRGGCVKCHGETGNEPMIKMYPKIGGQSEVYLYNQMIDYKEKRRKNGLYKPMETAITLFNEKEIKSIAIYLAGQGSF